MCRKPFAWYCSSSNLEHASTATKNKQNNTVILQSQFMQIAALRRLSYMKSRIFNGSRPTESNMITYYDAIQDNWIDVPRKNVVNNVDMSGLRAPWQNGPYKNQHTEQHKNIYLTPRRNIHLEKTISTISSNTCKLMCIRWENMYADLIKYYDYELKSKLM